MFLCICLSKAVNGMNLAKLLNLSLQTYRFLNLTVGTIEKSKPFGFFLSIYCLTVFQCWQIQRANCSFLQKANTVFQCWQIQVFHLQLKFVKTVFYSLSIHQTTSTKWKCVVFPLNFRKGLLGKETRDCVSMQCIPGRDIVKAWMCRAWACFLEHQVRILHSTRLLPKANH